MGEPWQWLRSGKPQVGAQLFDKAQQGRKTDPAHQEWWKYSRCSKNHLLLRHISFYVWYLEISKYKYHLLRLKTQWQWLQFKCQGGYRVSDPIAELKGFEKDRRYKGVFILTVRNISRWWSSAFNNINTNKRQCGDNK